MLSLSLAQTEAGAPHDRVSRTSADAAGPLSRPTNRRFVEVSGKLPGVCRRLPHECNCDRYQGNAARSGSLPLLHRLRRGLPGGSDPLFAGLPSCNSEP